MTTSLTSRPLPRCLYHGTSSLYLADILAEGLRPSSNPGTLASPWPTRPGYVHLTDCHFLYYALTPYWALMGPYDLVGLEIDTAYIEELRVAATRRGVPDFFGRGTTLGLPAISRNTLKPTSRLRDAIEPVYRRSRCTVRRSTRPRRASRHRLKTAIK